MISSQLAASVLALPEAERLELARRLVESVVTDEESSSLVAAGVRRIEQVVTGQVAGLSEEEFRRAAK